MNRYRLGSGILIIITMTVKQMQTAVRDFPSEYTCDLALTSRKISMVTLEAVLSHVCSFLFQCCTGYRPAFRACLWFSPQPEL